MKKNTIIVFILLCLLSTVYWVTKKEQISVGVKKISILKFDKKSIDQILVEGKNSINLSKQNNDWYVVKNEQKFIADKQKVDLMLEALYSLHHSYYVTKDKSRYSELGFIDNNQNIIKLFSNEKEAWSLIIGNKTNLGEYYAKKNNEDDIYAIKGDLSLALINNIDDIRVKNFINFAENKIQKISLIKNNNISFTLLKQNDTWSVDKNDDFGLDKETTNRYITNIKNLRAFAFVDEVLDLISPIFELEITEDNLTKKISFYHREKDYLVKTNQSEQVYKILQYNFDDLNKDLESLQDKKVIKFEPDNINKILIYSAKQVIDLQKEENAWKIKNSLPKDFEFDSSKIDFIISKLMSLKAVQILSKENFKENQSKNMIELFDKDNNKIAIKGYDYDINNYIVMTNNGKQSYIVEKNNFSFIIKNIDFFKKEDFEMPIINENTKGFKNLPIDVQKQLLEQSKKKMGNK